MKRIILAMIIGAFQISAFAQDGKILKVLGEQSGYVLREGSKIQLAPELELIQGDEIFSEEAVVLVHVFPSTQLSLAKNTQIKINSVLIEESAAQEKSSSIIGFIKGMIRLYVTKDKTQEIEQKVEADGVAFAVRGTDYEVAIVGGDVDLDVHEGAVEVSSPFVMTFVPQIVESGKGFRYNKKQRSFLTRKFGPRFKQHPRFLKKAEIQERWGKNKEARNVWMMERNAKKKKRLESLKQKREIRRSKKEKKKTNR